MRVHAVLQLAHGQVGTGHDYVRLLLGVQLLGEPGADGRVVLGGEGEGLRGEAAAQLDGGAAIVCLHLLHQSRVLSGRGADDHGGVVLGGRTQHGRTANIDVLDAGLEVVALRHGVLESVEIQHHEVDHLDAVVLHVLLMLGVASHGEDSSVHLPITTNDDRHLGVQGLHSSVHHLRGSGVLRNIHHLHASVSHGLGSATRGENLDSVGLEELGKVDQSGLIRHGKNGTVDLEERLRGAYHSEKRTSAYPGQQ